MTMHYGLGSKFILTAETGGGCTSTENRTAERCKRYCICNMTLSEKMTKRAYALTGSEDPNSVSQLKGWLEERGIEIDSLGKKNVAALIMDLDKHSIDSEAFDMMKLRLQMAK